MDRGAEHDEEGRVITLEFESFYLVNVYVSTHLQAFPCTHHFASHDSQTLAGSDN